MEKKESSNLHESFDKLVGQYYSLAYGRACVLLRDAHLAHDATQEAFTTAYQKLDQLREPRAFPAWLLRLVSTHCYRIRRRKSPVTVTLDVAENQPSHEPDPERQLLDSDLRRQIAERIDALPDHEREATRLYYIEGYSQQQVADAVGVPVQTVKSRLYSSRQRLHRGLEAAMCAGAAFAPGVPLRFAIRSESAHRSESGCIGEWHRDLDGSRQRFGIHGRVFMRRDTEFSFAPLCPGALARPMDIR